MPIEYQGGYSSMDLYDIARDILMDYLEDVASEIVCEVVNEAIGFANATDNDDIVDIIKEICNNKFGDDDGCLVLADE